MAGNPEQQPAAAAAAAAMEQPVVMAPRRKFRMHPADVRFTMSLKREDFGGTEYLERFAHKFSPEVLEEHRRLHEEVAAIFRKDNDEIEARQAQIARELAEKGYVEIDEADPADEEEYDRWADEEEYDRWAAEQWKIMTEKPWFKRMEAAAAAPVPAGAPGWTIRPHDTEEDEYEDDDDKYDDNEVESEYDDNEGQVQVIEHEDEKENTTSKSSFGRRECSS